MHEPPVFAYDEAVLFWLALIDKSFKHHTEFRIAVLFQQ